MAKRDEEKAVERLVDSISDIRFQDSDFAMNVMKQPPNIQRRIMRLFLTMVKYWGVDYKYYNYHNKDNDTVEVSSVIDITVLDEGPGKDILDNYEPPVVQWSNYKYDETAVNLDDYNK